MADRTQALSDQVVMWYTQMSDFVFKHSTFQLIVLGWIVSSEGTFDNATLRIQAVVVGFLVAYSAFTANIYAELRSKSDYAYQRLKRLDAELAEDVLRYRVTPKFLWSSILAHVSITAGSVFLVLSD